ncbi:hypothetical protein BH24ACT26_BH24ACT26_18750 [soil metagenome]
MGLWITMLPVKWTVLNAGVSRADARAMERRPVLVRRAVLAAALCLAALAAASPRPAVATDLESLRERAQVAADQVSALEHELEALRNRHELLAADVVRQSAQINLLEVAIHDTEADVARARDRYVERAVEAYKEGPTSDLALVLSSDDLVELLDAAEATDRAAADDRSALERLQVALSKQERAQKEVDARKQELMAAEQAAFELTATLERILEFRRAALAELSEDIAALEEQARLEAARAAQPDETFARLLAGSGPTVGIPEGYVGTGVAFEGLASWYGPGFEGNSTANGDIFDPDLYTAASRDLPFGTRLFVQYGGRGVVVVINDRGPYIEERILDLSRAAAEAIGVTGVSWVTAEIVVPAG